MLQDVTFAQVAKTNGYSGRHHALLPGIHPLLIEQLLRHPTKALQKNVLGLGLSKRNIALIKDHGIQPRPMWGFRKTRSTFLGPP